MIISSTLFRRLALAASLLVGVAMAVPAQAQIGQRFPSERRVVPDPVTGVPLVFLTSTPRGDSKIYPTHPQWTADGQWLVFRSDRAGREAIAVNEASGDMVQVTEGGYSGMLNLDTRVNRLVFLRGVPGSAAPARGEGRAMQAVEVDLDRLLADSAAGTLKGEAHYQRVFATVPAEWQPDGDSALDADGQWLYFRIGKEAALRLAPGVKAEPNFGPRNMGAGPTGIARVHRQTGQVQHVVSVGFQIGHVQANPWRAGELVFSWETGGKSPQRTWAVKGDGSGLRPLYPEAPYEWVTHEAVITADEVAMAIMGHRPIPAQGAQGALAAPGPAGTDWAGANPGQEATWGPSGTREKPTGLAVVNLRTREMRIEAQTPQGSGLWHVHGSPDGKWAVGDDFSRSLYLLNRRTGQLRLLSTGHRDTARDHPHPTFSADGKRIQIQSAMLSPDGRAMNIVVITVPEAWQAEAAALR